MGLKLTTQVDTMPPINWDVICQPKMNDGLGFRKSIDMKKVMLSKMAWFLTTNNNNLAAKLLKINMGTSCSQELGIARLALHHGKT